MPEVAFRQLKTDLRAILFPAGEAENLIAGHDKMFIDALVDLQRWVDCFQENNTSVHPFCSTYFDCGRTVVERPSGRVQKVYTIANDNWCDRVYYRQANIEEVDKWTHNVIAAYTAPSQDGFADMPALPMGFRYADASSDSTTGRCHNGIYAIHRGRIYLCPWIQSNEKLVVEWDGIKQDYGEDDLVTITEDMKAAILLFVRSQVAMDDFGDTQKSFNYDAKYKTALADLMWECSEQTRLQQLQLPASTGYTKEHEITLAEVDSEAVPATDESVVFAILGDYGDTTGTDGGYSGNAKDNVAALIKSWAPNFLVTVGDNWYGTSLLSSALDTSQSVYRNYIYPYNGALTSAATRNNFYPAFGNHDRDPVGRLPLELAYFNLTQPYYDFVRGPVHFFVLDSGYDNSQANQQAAGVTAGSVQGKWLQLKLALSVSKFKVVLLHHPPYSSCSREVTDTGVPPLDPGGVYLSYPDLRWPFKAWGADLVAFGHAHMYERLADSDGMTYLNSGLGGVPPAVFAAPCAQSQFRYNTLHGAIRCTVSCSQLKAEFINVAGVVIDTFTITK